VCIDIESIVCILLLLHFAWGIAEAKCILAIHGPRIAHIRRLSALAETQFWMTAILVWLGHGRLCVCLSLTALSHYCMDPDLTLGNSRMCSLLVSAIFSERFTETLGTGVYFQWMFHWNVGYEILFSVNSFTENSDKYSIFSEAFTETLGSRFYFQWNVHWNNA